MNTLEKDGLSIDLLYQLSFRSRLGINLKKNLHYFDKEQLMAEIAGVLDWYDEHIFNFDISADYRVKSYQSALLKYERYQPDHQAGKVFNDLLGFRSLCNSYDDIADLQAFSELKFVDLSRGKANDDGYRGVHVYFQINNFTYPIEIQYNTYYDRQLNNWLHKYLYKKEYPLEIGNMMRLHYEHGDIRTEKEFQSQKKREQEKDP